jgi:hypothetical protein
MARTLALAACLLVTLPAAAQQPPTYSVNFLGAADSVNALSETGVVTGQRFLGGNTRGWVASATTPLQLLPLPAGDQSSWALDVSEQGVIVGALSTSISPEFQGRAAKWLPDGSGGYTVHELGKLPGHSGSIATAVNNLGDIIGWSNTGMFRYPVLFSAPGGVLDLNPLGVFDPQSINDARVFVDKQGRRMDLDTMTVENLGLPQGPPSYSATTGYAINELGSIAGTAVLSTSTSCVYQATRYVDGAGWQMLSPCSGVANAYDINDQGDVLYKAYLSLVNLLRLEGYGDFDLQTLLEPQDQHWDVLGFGADINSARQFAAIVDDTTGAQTGVALLTPIQTCQASLGFAGPGPAQLAVCGGDLSTGTSTDLTLWGLPAFGQAFLVAGLVGTPTPLKGGTLVPVPFLLLAPVVAGPAGTLVLDGIPGGGGPAALFVQSVHADGSLPGGFGFSNAVRLDFLP